MRSVQKLRTEEERDRDSRRHKNLAMGPEIENNLASDGQQQFPRPTDLKGVGVVCMIWGSHSGCYEEYYLLGYNAV
jgi:hypothetical protein